jgi:hypothetical protein
MRRLSLVGGVAVATLATAVAGAAKEPNGATVATVCGRAACADLKWLSFRLSASNMFVRHVAPAPFYVVRFEPPPTGVHIPGQEDPIVYVPRTRVWRVTFDGLPVWLEVPGEDVRALRPAIRTLRAHPAPRSWAAAPTR